jgi:hypothetical protein
MSRSKLGLLGLCTLVLGTMAISTSSAQAAFSWLIWNTLGENPKDLKATVFGETDNTDLTLLTKLVGLTTSITCSGFKFIGLNIEVGGTLTTGFKVKYTGCEAYEKGVLGTPLKCHVFSLGKENGTIETNALKGALALHTLAGGGTEVLVKIEPVEEEALVTILTEECILPEANPLNGVLYIKDCEKKALTNSIKHLIEQGPLTSLYVGADTKEHLETNLDGSVRALLLGDHPGYLWAAMDA